MTYNEKSLSDFTREGLFQILIDKIKTRFRFTNLELFQPDLPALRFVYVDDLVKERLNQGNTPKTVASSVGCRLEYVEKIKRRVNKVVRLKIKK